MEQRAAAPVTLPLSHPTLSYWQDPPDEIADCRTTEKLPDEVDVVIIGSGVSGATIAHTLLSADPGCRVVMLEARQAASGASGRNGGHTKTASYRSFSENVGLVGKEDAIKIARLEYDCMVAVHDFYRKHDIDCDGRRCDTIDVFYDHKQWQAAQESVALMQKLMGKEKPAPIHSFYDSTSTSEQFYTPNSLGSLRYEAGSLSAYKFTIGILKLALGKGLNLQCNTPVERISKTQSAWAVETARGSVHTRKVVLATNGYTPYLYPKLQGVIVPFRGIVTAQSPGKSMPQQGLETTYSFIYEKGYEYMITRPEGTEFEGDIVIGGGLTKGRHEGAEEYGTTNDTSIDSDIEQYLTECTTEYFGQNWGKDHPEGRVRKTWSGIMGYSADGYPLVGPVPGEDGLFIDASFQGHGMVLCFLCARAVTHMMLGEDNEELESWFPNCFRVSEGRMQQRFSGRLKVSGATDVAQNGERQGRQ